MMSKKEQDQLEPKDLESMAEEIGEETEVLLQDDVSGLTDETERETDDAAESSGTPESEPGEKKTRPDFRKMFQTKNVRYGSYSAVMIAIVIVIAVVVNLIASVLPSGIQSVDLSSGKIYSIGKQTEKVLDKLDDPVTITVFSSKDAAEDSLVKLLQHYDDNKNVTVKYVDPALNPSVASQYSLSAGSVVVKCGTREQTIDSGDIYVSDYASYYSTGSASTTFDGEGQITSAIQYVTTADLPKMYTITGHGEQAVSSSVSSLISKQNVETEQLNLMTSGNIPEDCACLLINSPTSDYTHEEAEQIISYLDNGGKAIIIEYYSEEEQANFQSILNAYGLKTEDGIVMETANHFYQYPMYVIPQVASSDITQDFSSENVNILIPNALGLISTDAEGTTVTPLLQTSSGAYLKKVTDGQLSTMSKEDGDETDQFMLAALAGKEAEGSGELVVISSSSLIDDGVTQSFSLGNLDFFTACISYLTADDGVQRVSIDAKNMSADSITVSSFQSILWGAVLVILIPVAFLAAGFIIWLRRRRK